ncbi:MAG: HDOD domain-containing protein [Planctomycetota bacterium]
MSGELHFRPRSSGSPASVPHRQDGEQALFARRAAQPGGSAGALREAELLAAIDQVPALSSVVNKILSLAGSQTSSAADLENLVTRDMVITGRLLKLVNSPFYALANDVRSVTQAVAIVGMNSLRSLVVAASVSSMLMADMSPYGFDEEGLWQNSIAVAALSRRIALQARGDKDAAEDCFIGALLRNVGMLVLTPFLARNQVDLTQGIEGADDSIITGEQQYLGYDHVWVGQQLAERWDLPRKISALLAIKGRRVKEVEPDLQWPAAVLQLAERLANNSNVGLMPHHAFPRNINSRMIKQADLDAAGFKDLVAHVAHVVEAAKMDLR